MEIDYSPQSTPTAPYRQMVPGSDSAVLFLHGITGSPAAWFPIARALSHQGVSVVVPLLPGHGTRWQDLNATTWSDWLLAAKAEFDDLSQTHSHIVVAGLSMGGALALALGAGSCAPDDLILINPALYIDSPFTPALPVLKHFVPSVPAIAGDIAHPDRSEYAYERTPLAAVASFASAQRTLREALWRVECPVTLFVSGQDSVVGPKSLRALRSGLSHSPEIVSLRRSRHVATLDYDAPLIAEAILEKATSRHGTANVTTGAGE